MAQEKMDLDLEPLPSSTTIEDNTLRRSSSAPLINELRNDSQVFQPDTLRARRNSTTFVGQPCLEEGMDLGNRETIHEWEVQTAIQITQSWKESLNVGNNNLEKAPSPECSNLTPASSATFLTGRTGKVKWYLNISQRDFSKTQPTWFLLVLLTCLIVIRGHQHLGRVWASYFVECPSVWVCLMRSPDKKLYLFGGSKTLKGPRRLLVMSTLITWLR
ncbi:protein FAM122C isoform X2 [Camelus ferus]|uniref:Protein FAM122C isoform X2 n=1 Tax=Camelus ferus TaxID=419612 RepID=A0A8B7KGC4_CAMFR|nr:protein FAM122C isoform X2 [Camelus ferus]XP_031302228.1 protein FAM122C isoform X1 [Camelus dromedarius]